MSARALLAAAPLPPSLRASPESGASERSACKNQSGAMRQAAPQLANHRFEHQKRGGALHLPATLSQQPSFLTCRRALLSRTSPPPPAAHGRSLRSTAACVPQPPRFPPDLPRPPPPPPRTFDFSNCFFPPYFWICRRGALTRNSATFDGSREVGRLLTAQVRAPSRVREFL